MNNSTNYIILNGELIPEKDAKIPAVTSGLYYGAGAFETFLFESGKIFKFEEHVERLNAGLGYLGVLKNEGVASDLILNQIKKLLKKNNLLEESVRIRIQVSLAEKSGYSLRDDLSLFTIISSSSANKVQKSKTLILAENSVVSSSARPAQFKLSNMLHYRQAFREAEQKGADDAVLLNAHGFVAETSIANIFCLKDGNVFTPSIECDILPGIMRNSIIDILKNRMQFEVKEGKFSLDELMEADSVFITNSAIDFIPVAKFEDVLFDTEISFYSDLRDQLSAYKEINMTDA